MRFATLGSGSAGNATLVQSGDTAILIDCGLSARQVERRLEVLGCDAKSLDALVLTHEHDDHLAGAGVLAARYDIPIFLTKGTRRGAGERLDRASTLVEFAPETELSIGSITLAPAIVPHDAVEPCQFVVIAKGYRLGVLTDLGMITPHLLRHFQDLDALVIEFNHDVELLSASAYPASLQARIASRFGHLSNEQADDALCRLDTKSLRYLVAAHLSEKTNTPERVAALVEARVGPNVRWLIARQDEPMPWFNLE